MKQWTPETEDYEHLVLDQDGEVVATLPDKDHWSRAVLISAAPKMLKVLEKVARMYDPDKEWDESIDTGTMVELMDELHAEVLAVIAEADWGRNA